MPRKKKAIIDLGYFPQSKDEIDFLHKLKNNIIVGLLNGCGVKVPGLGTVELLTVKSGNRFKGNIRVFKLHTTMDESLKIILDNQRIKNG